METPLAQSMSFCPRCSRNSTFVPRASIKAIPVASALLVMWAAMGTQIDPVHMHK